MVLPGSVSILDRSPSLDSLLCIIIGPTPDTLPLRLHHWIGMYGEVKFAAVVPRGRLWLFSPEAPRKGPCL